MNGSIRLQRGQVSRRVRRFFDNAKVIKLHGPLTTVVSYHATEFRGYMLEEKSAITFSVHGS